jgi:hypothetical protein
LIAIKTSVGVTPVREKAFAASICGGTRANWHRYETGVKVGA